MTLADHYSRFRVRDRILLTGHSHQAWPDVAFEAQQHAWFDAAELVDDKWARAEEVAEDVRAGWRRLLNDPGGTIALGQNTHELVVRLLSAIFSKSFPIRPTRPTRPTSLLTTDGEFHTIRRQLDRLAEEGIEIVKIAARPVDALAERLAAAVDDRTACVLVSSVLFETAEIVPDLATVARACERHGATLLVDAYHHLNVVPFDLREMGLDHAFVTGGGYKYCQLGEGNCFLRVPRDCELRPVITGWFSEFEEIADLTASAEATAVKKVRATYEGGGSRVRYGPGAARFAGATYDPTSHYRARAVFAFHGQMKLTPGRLREISRRQVGLLKDDFDKLGIDPSIAHVEPVPDDRRGGFLAIRLACPPKLALSSRASEGAARSLGEGGTSRAPHIVRGLRARNVFADSRGDLLRLGPAPYLSDAQLSDGIAALADVLASRAPS